MSFSGRLSISDPLPSIATSAGSIQALSGPSATSTSTTAASSSSHYSDVAGSNDPEAVPLLSVRRSHVSECVGYLSRPPSATVPTTSSLPKTTTTTTTSGPPATAAVVGPAARSSNQQYLMGELAEAKRALKLHQSKLDEMRASHETQLSQLSRQLLDLEGGLRKKERDLKAALCQRDRLIREQANVIRFLIKKSKACSSRPFVSSSKEDVCRACPTSSGRRTSGGGSSSGSSFSSSPKASPDIGDLCNEAVAKIPNLSKGQLELHKQEEGPRTGSCVGRIRKSGSSCKDNHHPTFLLLTSISEDQGGSSSMDSSQNGGDSDSAIIVDDPNALVSSTGTSESVSEKGSGAAVTVSRSISDVVSSTGHQQQPHHGLHHYHHHSHHLQNLFHLSHHHHHHLHHRSHHHHHHHQHHGHGLHHHHHHHHHHVPHDQQQRPYQDPVGGVTIVHAGRRGENCGTEVSAGGSIPEGTEVADPASLQLSQSCGEDDENDDDDDDSYCSSSWYLNHDVHTSLTPPLVERRFFRKSSEPGHVPAIDETLSGGNNGEGCDDEGDADCSGGDCLASENSSYGYLFRRRSCERQNLKVIGSRGSLGDFHRSVPEPMTYCTLPRSSKRVDVLPRQQQQPPQPDQVRISNKSTFILINQDDNNNNNRQLHQQASPWSSESLGQLKNTKNTLISAASGQDQQQQQQQAIRKNFMTPRDVKNRSSKKIAQQVKCGTSSSLCGLSSGVPTGGSKKSNRFVKKTGSVYCSLVMQESDLDSQSFA